MSTVGIVIIGRNEGARLEACLKSVRRDGAGPAVVDVVYVDSNSTDGSCETARAQGARVVPLAADAAFTAGLARNAGARALLEAYPETTYLQFLDGDTALNPAWISHAAEYMDIHGNVSVTCGRRRERFPAASIYNRLGDMEWNTRIGKAGEFGGDALVRATVFRQLGGYDEHFIAGEEPEFAARIRLAGHTIVRLNHEMTLHDLGMTRFSQWLRRNRRSGHAIAQLHHVHGGAPLHWYRQAWRSTWLWGAAVPLAVIAAMLLAGWWAIGLLPVAYAYLALRIFQHRLRHGDDRASASLYAIFTTVGKFPQLLGMLAFYWNHFRRRPSKLIEYKAGTPATAGAAGGVMAGAVATQTVISEKAGIDSNPAPADKGYVGTAP